MSCATVQFHKIPVKETLDRPLPRPRRPHGLWVCADGSEVLFDQFFHPLAQRWPVKPIKATDWVHWIEEHIFFGNGKGTLFQQALKQVTADFAADRDVSWWFNEDKSTYR